MLRISTKPDINSQNLSEWPPRPPRPQSPPSTLSALGPRQTTGPFFVNSMQPPIMVGLHPRCATIRLVTTPPRVSPKYCRAVGSGRGKGAGAIDFSDSCWSSLHPIPAVYLKANFLIFQSFVCNQCL